MNKPRHFVVDDDEPGELRLTQSEWARLAANTSAPPPPLKPDAPATRGFHVRFNHWEMAALQVIADADFLSKQQVLRGAMREYLRKRLKTLGVTIG